MSYDLKPLPPLAALPAQSTPSALMAAPIPLRTPPLMRTLLGIPALILGLALIVPTVHAQADAHRGHSAADHAESGTFVVKVGPNGDLVCEHARETEITALRSTPGAPLNFTVFSSTNVEQNITGMRILLRATDQLLEFPGALLAFRRAAARWERAISTPITVVIDVDFGPERFNSGPFPQNVLASATNGARTFTGVGPAEIVEALLEQNGEDPQLQALYEAIPIPTPSTAGSNLGRAVIARPLAQAYGYLPAESDPDPILNPFGEFATIGFNSAFQWDFNPADGVSSGQFDFEAVALHEMGHSLGFTSIIGNGGPPNNLFTILDFFRVRPEAVTPGEPLDDGEGWEVAERVVTPGPPSPDVVQVFFDGLEELPLSTATGSREGGDGQQASHWRDDALGTPYIGIMDPNFANGTVGNYSENDLRAFEVIGYNVINNVPIATALFTVNGEPLDIAPPDSLEFLDLGDAAPDGSVALAFGLTNTSDSEPLNYEVEVELEVGFPSGVDPSLSVDAPEGSIAPGALQTVTLTAGATERSLFYGVFRIETNADNALVVEVPFRFSVDGGTAPRLALSTEDAGNLGDFNGEGPDTRPLLTVSNEGGLGLDYRVATSFVQNAEPFPFDNMPRMAGGDILFAEDFEEGLGDFVAGGAFPGDWQVVDEGPAALEGHSLPNAAYFGQVLQDGTLQYRNLASGILVSPPLDLSGVPQQDLVVLSFNTYIQAEAGSDIATVLVSLDDGETYREVATSDGGILFNRDEWRNISIELPLVSGLTTPVRVAFQFVSDPTGTDIGWLVDDVTLSTIPDIIPAFVSPVSGTIAGGESQELELTVEGGQLETGFYRGAATLITNSLEFSDAGVPVGFTDGVVRVVGVIETVPFTLSVGDPGVPDLTPPPAPLTAAVPSDQALDVEFEVENDGGAAVTFVRLLEPALSDFLDGAGRSPNPLLKAGSLASARDVALAEAELPDELPTKDLAATAARSSVAGGDSLYAAEITGASPSIGAITQLPDGRVVVADFGSDGRTYVFPETLGAADAEVDGFASGGGVTGIAYNDETASLWYALDNGNVIEATLDGTTLTVTGRNFSLDFMEDGPGSISYSAALGAFLIPERRSQLLYAVSADGVLLPGYPVQTPSRAGLSPGVSVTRGVVEVISDNLAFTQTGQFGRDFEEAAVVEVSRPRLGGSPRINGILRSRTNPDGVLYYLARPSGGRARIVAVDPPDLPAYTGTLVEAGEALFGIDLEPGGTLPLEARVVPAGRTPGVYADTLTFLTNNPTDRLVRIPFEISVTPSTGAEDGAAAPTAFAIHQNYPNPFSDQTMLAFDLATAARSTLTVYNVLGQRVSVLLDAEPLEAGTHEVPFNARGLAAGTYVVRLQADGYTGAQRITIVR
jgi:hypothetical protein